MLASQKFWRRLRHLSADGNGNATKRKLWKIVSVLDQRNKLRQLHTSVVLLQKLPRITAIRGKLLLLQSPKPACSSLLIHIERQPHSQLRLLTVVPRQGQSRTHHCSTFDFQIRRPMHSCPHRYSIPLPGVYLKCCMPYVYSMGVGQAKHDAPACYCRRRTTENRLCNGDLRLLKSS